MKTSFAAIVFLIAAFLIGLAGAIHSTSDVGHIAGTYALPFLLGLPLTAGLAWGHRLAWRWGRVATALGGTWLAAETSYRISLLAAAPLPTTSLVMGLQSLLLIAAFFLLGSRGARKRFNLICPRCHGTDTGPANFEFTKARCRKCHVIF